MIKIVVSNEEDFKDYSFTDGFDKGDIIFAVKSNKPEIGDVIIFNANTKHPIIHRIVSIEEKNGKLYYSTKGDNNPSQLPIEKEILQEESGHQVEG